MAYHPAAFARKGRTVLAEARYRLSKAGSDIQRTKRLVAHYDRRVAELMKGRQEMDRGAYREWAISYLQWGGSIVFFMILLGGVLYSAITDTTVAVVHILLIGVLGGVGGGIVIMAWRAPKDLSYSERKDQLLVKLYEDGNILRTCYEAIIKPYKVIFEEEERKAALQGQTQRANVLLKEGIREEKERKWAALDAMSEQTGPLKPTSTAPQTGRAAKGRAAKKKRRAMHIWERLSLFGGRERIREKDELQISGKPKLLLIADRDETIHPLLGMLGDSFDCSVIRPVSEEAFPATGKVGETLRVALVDLDLSTAEGLGVIQRLKGLDGLNGIPLIALSHRSDAEDRDRAMAEGFAAYIVKETDGDGRLVNDRERLLLQIERGIRRSERGIDEGDVEQAGASLNSIPVEEVYEEENSADEEPPKKGRLLLVCETDDSFSIQKSLEDWGYEVIPLEDPRKAIQIALAKQPDLILLDDGLREINAFNVYRMLQMRARSLPILMTVAPDQEHRAKEMEIGIYLVKPLTSKELETIDAIVGVFEEKSTV